MVEKERRSCPRIKDEGLPLKLRLNDFDAVTHTLDLSASGVYCKIQNHIPLMSCVQLVLEVPDGSKSGKAVSSVTIEGVVVREHPVIIDGQVRHYDCAIFFNNLSSRTRDIISDYIASKKA